VEKIKQIPDTNFETLSSRKRGTKQSLVRRRAKDKVQMTEERNSKPYDLEEEK
jgi:hypothetical protein